MITLALALRRNGHAVTLIGPPERTEWAGRMDCPYQPCGQDVTAFINRIHDVYSVRSALCFNHFVRQEIRSQFKTLPDIIGSADLVIASSLMIAVSSIAEACGTPYRYLAFTPQLLPSGNHPFPLLTFQYWPAQVNRFSWVTADLLNRFNFTQLVNQYRTTTGLSPLKNLWPHILSTRPIVASDPQVVPVPLDDITGAVQTGFLHPTLPVPDNPELEAFLDSGPAPVYAGFGSMPPKDQEKNMHLLIRAARKAGTRMVIAKFWKNDARLPDRQNFFFISNYPHLALFPRMSAAVHHGGAGTTAAAAISGIPQIIVPHILDQFYHGDRIYRAGLGPRPIPVYRLTTDRLARSLKQVKQNTHYRRNAFFTSQSISREKSLQRTVMDIEGSIC